MVLFIAFDARRTQPKLNAREPWVLAITGKIGVWFKY